MIEFLLSLTEGRSRIRKWRNGKLLRPDQFLFSFEPLLEKDLHLAGPIRPEAHGSNHDGHVCCRDGVADLVPVEHTGARTCVGQDLYASIGKPYDRNRRA